MAWAIRAASVFTKDLPEGAELNIPHTARDVATSLRIVRSGAPLVGGDRLLLAFLVERVFGATKPVLGEMTYNLKAAELLGMLVAASVMDTEDLGESIQ